MKLAGKILVILLSALALGLGGVDTHAATPKQKNVKTTKTVKKTTTKKTAAPRSADKIRSEQNATRQRINETSSKISSTGAELKRQLNNLNSLNADIMQQQAKVTDIRAYIDSLHTAIGLTSDSIAILESRLEDLRAGYADALRKLQPSASSMSALSFIFTSSSFAEAYSRLRYLQRFSEWRQKKAREIDRAIDRVAARRQHLTSLRHQQDRAYRDAREAEHNLARKQSESKQLVADLRKQDVQLRAELAQQKKQAQALDRELDRLIAAEQERIAREEAARRARESKTRAKAATGQSSSAGAAGSASSEAPSARDVASARAETRAAASTSAADLTGSFASNKGRLLFPVAGRYKIVRQFGRQPHPTQRHVVTDNSGIDIEVSPGSNARAVFAGTVSAIFHQDGFQTIVMLRHGNYLTIYAGLSAASVRVGQKVTAGQTLGTIFSDPADSNRTILHFEVRNEKTKLNPTAWVK